MVGTLIGRRNRPHLLEAWGQRFNLQLEDHVTLFRYRDVPGMIGRVGTVFGEHGINIVSAAVGPPARGRELAATTASPRWRSRPTSPVPHEVVDEIVAGEGFVAGRTVNL